MCIRIRISLWREASILQYEGIVALLVRDNVWRGTKTDKLMVDEFLDLEYKDTEEASPASTFLKNTLSS